MRYHSLQAISLLFLIIIASCAESAAQTGARRRQRARPQQSKPTVLFDSMGYGRNQIILPVAIMQGGRYIVPPAFQMKRARRQFADTYYHTGQKYRLLSRGREVGTVTVKNLETCDAIAANVDVQSAATPEARLLATNSGSLGGKLIPSHDLTEAEKTAFMKLVQPVFRRGGLDEPFYEGVANVVEAVDLDGDGAAELIGTIANGAKSEHTLFIIAEPRGDGFRPALLLFHPSRDKTGDDRVRRDFVDALDLDGDGVSEVITTVNDYRSPNDWDYVIYKKQGGRWRSIYRGAGMRCPEERTGD